jgi:hypothetical protein
MTMITAQSVVAFFADEDARVNDEVARIGALLLERDPASGRPKHIKNGSFSLTIASDFDAAFMENVAAKFRDSGEGWTARVVNRHDISGPHQDFVLSHESFKALPSLPSRGNRISLG